MDDIGFTEAMIDAIASDYSINLERVYATGMSNGGFMSFLLACQLSDKIAAIASVTGSMTPETYNNCSPEHPMPALHIHGTTDLVVAYDGAPWTESVEDVLNYWVGFNNCSADPGITEIPNTSANDGSTVEHLIYAEGDNNTTVEHFKITGGGHTWPGSFVASPGTNYDIDASFEIWKFFSRYDINGLIPTTTSLEEQERDKVQVRVFPNPTTSKVVIQLTVSEELKYELSSSFGEKILAGVFNTNEKELDLAHLPKGIYFLNVFNDSRAFSTKVVKE